MGKIYRNQTNLTFFLETNSQLLADALAIKIKYQNPKGIIGEWTAEIDNLEKGIIKHSILEILDHQGIWILWAKITDANGLISIGEPSKIEVHKEGT